MKVTSLPTASGDLASGSVSASASPFYNHTDAGRAAQHSVRAGVDLHTPKALARLIQNPRNHAEEIENAMKEFGYGYPI